MNSVKVIHLRLLLPNIDAVREMIERDWHITYREIQASLDIDMKAIYTILHDLERTESLQSLDPTQFDQNSKTGSS